MTNSKSNWHIVGTNLRASPYLACIAGIAAVVLVFWVPIFPAFLSVAAALGAFTFAVQWIGVRLRTSLGFVGTLSTIIAFALSRRSLLPRGMAGAELALAGAQFLAVWMLVFAALHIVFRARLTRDLEDRAPQSSLPPSK
jgi:hypothetical protein